MSEHRYCSYPVFKVDRAKADEIDRVVAAKELSTLLDNFSDKVETRGVYTTSAFTARADLMFWWIASEVDDIERLLLELERTQLGRVLERIDMSLGVTQPAEFARDHQPAFVKGEEPKKYICVYPFVRTPEWYLLDPGERGQLLQEHGAAGREFPDVLANTTSAFGLGDWEWILCFEADEADRLVDCIRRLRDSKSRLYAKVEVPFVTGIRKAVADALDDLR